MRYALLLALFVALGTQAVGQVSNSTQVIYSGSSGTQYPMMYPDTVATTAAVSSATTTPLITGSATLNTYVFFAGAQNQNTTNQTLNFKWGGGATCDTNKTTLLPANQTSGAAPKVGGWTTGWSGTVVSDATNSAGQDSPSPAHWPLIIPAGNNFCMVTGSTGSVVGAVYYTQAVAQSSTANSQQVVYTGSTGGSFTGTYPDNYVVGAQITATATTTTQVIAGVAGQNIYAFFLGAQSAGGGGTTTIVANWEWGTGASCSSPTKLFLGGPRSSGAGMSAGAWVAGWHGSTLANLGAMGNPAPSAIPLIIPAGQSVCIVTVGNPMSLYPVSAYAIH